MKKAIAILLLVAYFIPTFGGTITTHYCRGKAKFTNIVGLSKHKQCCKGKPMKMGCCHNKKISFKKNNTNEQVSKLLLLNKKVSDVFANKLKYSFDNENVIFHFISKSTFANNSPPPDAKHPIYIKHCVFLI